MVVAPDAVRRELHNLTGSGVEHVDIRARVDRDRARHAPARSEVRKSALGRVRARQGDLLHIRLTVRSAEIGPEDDVIDVVYGHACHRASAARWPVAPVAGGTAQCLPALGIAVDIDRDVGHRVASRDVKVSLRVGHQPLGVLGTVLGVGLKGSKELDGRLSRYRRDASSR